MSELQECFAIYFSLVCFECASPENVRLLFPPRPLPLSLQDIAFIIAAGSQDVCVCAAWLRFALRFACVSLISSFNTDALARTHSHTY